MKMWPALMGAILVLLPGTIVVMLAQDNASADSASRRIVDSLDRLIQNRFRSTEGMLGVSRLPRIKGHEGVRLYGATPQERKLIDEVNAARHPYALYFLHLNPPPATKAQFAGRIVEFKEATYTAAMKRSPKPALIQIAAAMQPGVPASKDRSYEAKRDLAVKLFDSMNARVQEAERTSAADAKHGRPTDSDKDGWLVATRPIIASDKTCISCHTRSKQGDTLGAMVYVVRSESVRQTN